jgi:hypothetical protein
MTEMLKPHGAPAASATAVLVRRGLIALTVVGILATAVALATERDWNSPEQLIFWAALLVLAVATVLLAIPAGRGVTAARVLALLVLATSIYRVITHMVVNYEAGPLDPHYAEVWNSLPMVQRCWFAATTTVGPAPTLAAGLLGQAALLLLLATLASPRVLSRPPHPRVWIAGTVVVVVFAVGLATLTGPSGLSGGPGVGQPASVPCTTEADVRSPPPPDAGPVVCLAGTSGERLSITKGGTVDAPVIYSGGGTATVRGIDVEASNVIIQGFTSTQASAMGAKLLGDNITFQDNVIVHPVNTGEDTDGIRFFGDHIKILHNTITDIGDGSNCTNDGCGHPAFRS